jgi:hypothetical protein
MDCFTAFAMTSYMLYYNISGTGRKGEIRTVFARHEAIHTSYSPDCFLLSQMTSYMLCCNISGTGRKGEARPVIARRAYFIVHR